MTDATIDNKTLLYNLRRALETTHPNVAALLAGAELELDDTSDYSRRRWNETRSILTLTVPAEALAGFDEPTKKLVGDTLDKMLPPKWLMEVSEVHVTPFLESPPDDDEPLQNTGSLRSNAPHEHDGLRFRSKSEIRIYEALKKQAVLFFANATAVLGGKDLKREPDFLVCQEGKWGILEVMGEMYHPSAIRDHERGRLFKDYGLLFIEFYSARQCYNDPEGTVADFLGRLRKA